MKGIILAGGAGALPGHHDALFTDLSVFANGLTPAA